MFASIKKTKELLTAFGTIPDTDYFPGEMASIRSYYKYRRQTDKSSFMLDEITWHDLAMDELFQRINPRLTTSGEQYLYYWLRCPTQTEAEYQSRLQRITAMEREEKLRQCIQLTLSGLGRSRGADMAAAFAPKKERFPMLPLYLLLSLGVIVLLLLAFTVNLRFGVWALLLLLCNGLLHEKKIHFVQHDFDTVNYSIAMVTTMSRLRRLKSPLLNDWLAEAWPAWRRLKALTKTGGVTVVNNDVLQLFSGALLLDLILFELLKQKLAKNYQDVFTIHEHLGQLDAAIAAASFRHSLPHFCQPELDFAPDAAACIHSREIYHPLLQNPVGNDLELTGSLLITGSNASGKSTYLKAVALNGILAQTLCTCCAESYQATSFYFYTSMALNDDLQSGESYYIVETKSLKRILDAARRGRRILCAIDEVLRGTNTVERIAASTELLAVFSQPPVLTIAATHDIELCSLLAQQYRLAHFSEEICQGAMHFDYRLKPGPAHSRNAIRLLELLGFDQKLVEQAEKRAAAYLQSGVWQA